MEKKNDMDFQPVGIIETIYRPHVFEDIPMELFLFQFAHTHTHTSFDRSSPVDFWLVGLLDVYPFLRLLEVTDFDLEPLNSSSTHRLNFSSVNTENKIYFDFSNDQFQSHLHHL